MPTKFDAGTLAGITPGAKVAIYKPTPPHFPPLGSDHDKQRRFINVLLEVTEATRASARAAAMDGPFDLPPGARGRLVEPGTPDRLRCAVMPANNAIEDALSKSSFLEVVGEGQAQALLKRQDGTWALVDDLHGAKAGYPVLCRLNGDQ